MVQAEHNRPATVVTLTSTVIAVIPLEKLQSTVHGEDVVLGNDVPVSSAIQPSRDEWEKHPANARNWPLLRKWTTVFIVALYTFLTPLASSMMAPGLPELAIKYDITNKTMVALTLSIFLLPFAIVLTVFAPLSEMYGRTWVLHTSNLLFMGFNLGCAFAPDTNSLIGLRFIAGLAGGAPVACGPGSISDLFSERDRALAMAIYSLGPLLGPVFGPIAGGFIVQAVGVEYIFVVISAFSGLATMLGIILLRETYAPVIRRRRATRSRDPENKPDLRFIGPAQDNKLQYLWINLSRPATILFRSLICFLLSLYLAYLFGIFYLIFTTFPKFFSSTYGFSAGIRGLTYLGIGAGFIIAVIFGARWGNKIYHHLADKNGGKGKPEMRMPALIFGSFFVPIGLLWYGWSAQAKLHWIMPMIGTGIFGFGMLSSYLPISLYLVDAFEFAASATAAAAVFRSLMGFAFPLFGEQIFDAIGMGGGNSLLAGFAIILGIPFPAWIYYKGEASRLNSKLRL